MPLPFAPRVLAIVALFAVTGACSRAPAEPPLEFAEARRFSQRQYNDVARRCLPLDLLARKATAALLASDLFAIEEDAFENDTLRRNGAIVLLGREDGMIVGLTTRFYADIRYPDVRLIEDGWGLAEIGAQSLVVYSDRDVCARRDVACKSAAFELRPRRKQTTERPHRQQSNSNGAIVEYRMFDDNDIALLYFPANAPVVGDRENLGLLEPTKVIKRHIDDSSQLFGFKLNLVSDESLAVLRSAIQVESVGEKLLIAGFSLVLGPVIGLLKIPFQSLPKAIVDPVAEQIRKRAGAVAARYATDALDGLEYGTQHDKGEDPTSTRPALSALELPAAAMLDSPVMMAGGLRMRISDRPFTVRLLGLVIPEPEFPEAEPLRRYLEQAANGAQWIPFTSLTHQRGMLLVPAEQLNLNLELLRHGYVRLDLDDRDALRAFPEFAEAAKAALDDGLGHARIWREDSVYVARVGDAASG